MWVCSAENPLLFWGSKRHQKENTPFFSGGSNFKRHTNVLERFPLPRAMSTNESEGFSNREIRSDPFWNKRARLIGPFPIGEKKRKETATTRHSPLEKLLFMAPLRSFFRRTPSNGTRINPKAWALVTVSTAANMPTQNRKRQAPHQTQLGMSRRKGPWPRRLCLCSLFAPWGCGFVTL